MPFASINPTNPRTNLWNFPEKFLRIGDFEKHCFFESAILKFFFRKKKFFFAFFSWKLDKVYWLARMGQNFGQVKRDNTFSPMPNILKGSVHSSLVHQQTYCIYVTLLINFSNVLFKKIDEEKSVSKNFIRKNWEQFWSSALEWPALWRITMNSLHNEGIYKWVN